MFKRFVGSFIAVLMLFVFSGCEFEEKSKNDLTNSTILKDVGDYYLVGGDILLDKDDPGHKILIDDLKGVKSSRSMSSVYYPAWPNKIVNYAFIYNFSDSERNNIKKAMNTIATFCGVQFIETTPGDYVYKINKIIDPNIGGQSTLGYCKNAHYDFVQNNYGTILHELLHGLGFRHEHQRPDRDKFISINSENILPEFVDQFEIIHFRSYFEIQMHSDYDYDSIMHYPNFTNWEINPDVPSINSYGHVIGQRIRLSNGDIKGLLELYGAPVQPKFFSVDIDGDRKSEIIKLWNTNNMTSIQILKYNGSALIERWTGIIGGWSEDIHDLIMDLNGDGKTELVRLWNNNGMTYAHVLGWDGAAFVQKCNQQLGGWASNIRELPMDIDGNGSSELVRLWCYNGLTYAHVLEWTGSSFTQKWNQQVGGWSEDIHDVVMDVNGDGKSELIRMWNNSGMTYAHVLGWDGISMVQKCNQQIGGWANNIRELPMDIDGNGSTELVRLWCYNGLTYAHVLEWTGSSFAQKWNQQIGGWSEDIRDVVMDLNEDGKSELVRMWNYSGMTYAHVLGWDGISLVQKSNQQIGGWDSDIPNIIGDYNFDGQVDIVRVWRNNGINWAQFLSWSQLSNFIEISNNRIDSN